MIRIEQTTSRVYMYFIKDTQGRPVGYDKSLCCAWFASDKHHRVRCFPWANYLMEVIKQRISYSIGATIPCGAVRLLIHSNLTDVQTLAELLFLVKFGTSNLDQFTLSCFYWAPGVQITMLQYQKIDYMYIYM